MTGEAFTVLGGGMTLGAASRDANFKTRKYTLLVDLSKSMEAISWEVDPTDGNVSQSFQQGFSDGLLGRLSDVFLDLTSSFDVLAPPMWGATSMLAIYPGRAR